MLVDKLIELDNKLTSKQLIKQRIEALHLRNDALWSLISKNADLATIFSMRTENDKRIANLLKKVVD